MKRGIRLLNKLSPGDVVMLTAAVRDLHRSHPEKFQTSVQTSPPPGMRKKTCYFIVFFFVCHVSLIWCQEAWYSARLNESKIPPMVVAKLGGQEVGLVFDTGANRLYLNRGTEDKAGKKEKVRIANGKVVDFPSVPADDLILGIRTFMNLKPLLAELTAFREFVGVPCAGVFPAAILDDSSMLFDFDKHELKLFTGGFETSAAYAQSYGLSFENRLPKIGCKIEGVEQSFLIDTGDTECLSLTRATVSEFLRKKIVEIRAGRGRSVDASGLNEEGDDGWFLTGTLMGKKLRGVSFSVDAETKIGMGWLIGFNFVIDMKNQKLLVNPRVDSLPPIPTELMTGAVLRYTEEGLIVERLKPGGGMAQEAGLEVGDRLISFGGSALAGIDGYAFTELVRTHANSLVPFTVWKAGTKKTVNRSMRLPEVVSDWDFAGRSTTVRQE